jgi:hypothetical protein
MRLLQLTSNGELSLTKDRINNTPPYAILSHTWGDDEEEVTFKDLLGGSGKTKTGYPLRWCRQIFLCAPRIIAASPFCGMMRGSVNVLMLNNVDEILHFGCTTSTRNIFSSYTESLWVVTCGYSVLHLIHSTSATLQCPHLPKFVSATCLSTTSSHFTSARDTTYSRPR